jgi:long-chain acyl-CoA synthetase
VAPEKLENVLQASKFVEQIFVYGDSLQSCVVAVVVPNKEILLHWIQDHLHEVKDLATCCKNPQLINQILADLYAIGKIKLRSWEIPRAIFIELQPFTPGRPFIMLLS